MLRLTPSGPPPMTLGLALTAFGLSLRHGIGWDHIAAIAALAQAAGRGLVRPDRHRRLYQVLAGVVAAASIGLGLVYLAS